MAFVAVRATFRAPMANVDEMIPLKLAEAMSARGALDPNWRFADLPGHLRYDQYNFYLYNVAAYAVIKVAEWFSVAPLSALRLANLGFQLAALAFALDALRRIGVTWFGLAFAGALIAFAPGMVHDAAMARPESLLYLLAALLLWVLTIPVGERVRALLAGLVLGAGIAVKLTFASLALLLVVPWAAWLRAGQWKELGASMVVVVLGTAAGVAVAAPYAVIHLEATIHGIATLAHQYVVGHPPHSLPAYGTAAQAGWIGRYFLELYGALPLLALAAPFLLKGAQRIWAVGLVACWCLLVIYFATKPVFFERNFSHGLIPLVLAAALAAAGMRAIWLRAAIAIMLLPPMAYWSIQIASATRWPERQAEFELAQSLGSARRITYEAIHGGEMPERCDTVAVMSFNDPWSRTYLDRLAQGGFTPIAHYRSRFSPLVTSTLHTYLDRDVRYFRCP